jgi:magnesium transporter
MMEIYSKDDRSFRPLISNADSKLKIPEGSWINVVTPDPEIVNSLAEATGIDKELLLSSLDEEESARIDVSDGDTLIVLDAPYLEDEEKSIYLTAPFLIAYNKKYLVTIARHPNELVSEVLKKTKNIDPEKRSFLSLHLIYRLATLFISYLKKIDVLTKNIEKELHDSMKNRELFELMDINKILVYFSTALNADKGVFARLLRSSSFGKSESSEDLMDDTEVELNQAIEMCTIYRDILAGMMDAFASIISNNLNIVMKTFAIITIVISIPTLIASFFGMNFASSRSITILTASG